MPFDGDHIAIMTNKENLLFSIKNFGDITNCKECSYHYHAYIPFNKAFFNQLGHIWHAVPKWSHYENTYCVALFECIDRTYVLARVFDEKKNCRGYKVIDCRDKQRLEAYPINQRYKQKMDDLKEKRKPIRERKIQV